MTFITCYNRIKEEYYYSKRSILNITLYYYELIQTGSELKVY